MHFTSDITFEKDSPIFTTGKHQLVYVCGGEVDDRETEMIAVSLGSITILLSDPPNE